ncbi:MAG: hypothetical protein IJD02_03015 [Lachnospiraceae bacterium]|nr:hypothetical protein [Lachnospiraceae bacterium]
MGIPKLCKQCKHGVVIKGDQVDFKTNAFCCHPSEIKNGFGKPLTEKVKDCVKFMSK